MSLYQLQKFLYDINRDPGVQGKYRADLERLLDQYELTSEERGALAAGDIGLIYVLGANGQLLMQYAAFLGISWPEYIQAMRDGVIRHGRSLQRPDRGPGLARHPAHQRPRECRTLATADRRDHADGGRRIRRGMEIRPRYHGAAELLDTGVRPARRSGQHQLSGAASHTAPSCLGLRRGAAPRRGPRPAAARRDRHRRHLALARDARLRKDQRSLGSAAARSLGAQ